MNTIVEKARDAFEATTSELRAFGSIEECRDVLSSGDVREETLEFIASILATLDRALETLESEMLEATGAIARFRWHHQSVFVELEFPRPGADLEG